MQNITRSPVEKSRITWFLLLWYIPGKKCLTFPQFLKKTTLYCLILHSIASTRTVQTEPKFTLDSTFIFTSLQENNRKHNNICKNNIKTQKSTCNSACSCTAFFNISLYECVQRSSIMYLMDIPCLIIKLENRPESFFIWFYCTKFCAIRFRKYLLCKSIEAENSVAVFYEDIMCNVCELCGL